MAKSLIPTQISLPEKLNRYAKLKASIMDMTKRDWIVGLVNEKYEQDIELKNILEKNSKEVE